jgi:hypothetical protein
MKNLKKSVALLSLILVAFATVAAARPHHRVSDAQVQAAIDARLHELLVKLNEAHR